MFSGISQNFWINIIGFQLIWWGCVLFGNTWLAIIWALLGCHLLFHREPIPEACYILICATLGFGIDTLLTFKGFFIFQDSVLQGAVLQGSTLQSQSPQESSVIPPLWLFALWISFSATLRQSLGFFSKHYVLAAILGAIGGSGSYLTAEKFDQVSFGFTTWYTGFFLAFIWSILFPLLIWVSHYIPRGKYAKVV